jgi:hypothetical protein
MKTVVPAALLMLRSLCPGINTAPVRSTALRAGDGSRSTAISVLLLLVLLTFPAPAWNAVGHRTVAELVWRQMSPAERQAAADLLRQHPHYEMLLAVDVPARLGTNESVFLNAAVWPDWVRPARPGQPPKPELVTKYNAYPHGIELPFVQPADVGRVSLEKFPVPKPIIQTALSNSIATLRNRNASPHDRAVSLCWALHLCGDLHQPLHMATLVTPDKPGGHGAGGDLVVLDRHGKQIDLHALWDQLPGVDFSHKAVAALADQIAAAPELQPARLNEYRAHGTVVSWGQESYQLAGSFAYAENRIQFVDAAEVRSGQAPASAIPVLKEDYLREARQIARRRLALAAWRLAAELNGAW